ncbi:MAG TPA: VOC family protein [Sphingomicrobium sp.]|nr:VOC family protein [Sphingomicrobium sp.]
MAELNHTIVWCSDKQRSAAFLTDILDLPPARPFFHFLVVDLSNGVSLDYYQKEGPVSPQHYAFLVSDEEFDAGFERIKSQGLDYWADPARTQPGQINHHFGGRGVYFFDPDEHLLELITRPYGSEGQL